MKKYITIVFMALMTSVMFSCKKDADIAGSEAKLPSIQFSSLGYQQLTPFASNAVVQFLFGATATNNAIASLKLEFFAGTSITGTAAKTITFSSFPSAAGTTGKDDSSTGSTTNHTVSYVLEPTTYLQTKVYGGSVLVKMSALALTSGSTYSVRATITGTDGKTSVVSQTSFFKMQ